MNYYLNPKIITPLALAFIFVLAIGVNYIDVPSWLTERSADEHAYIGLANRLIYLQNKEPSVLFPWHSEWTGVLSYSLGIASLISSAPIEAVWRVAHALTLLFIVLSAYTLGKSLLLNEGARLAFAALVALLPSTGTWVGPAAMVPSTLALVPILNIIAGFAAKKWKLLSVWIISLALFYWWLFIPTALFLLIYLLFRRVRSPLTLFFGWAGVAAGLVFLQPLFIKMRWFSSFTAHIEPAMSIFKGNQYAGGTNYFQFLIYHTEYLLPFVAISLFGVFWLIIRTGQISGEIEQPSSILGLFLTMTSVLFLLAGGERVFSRSIAFFFIGLLLLVIHFFQSVFKRRAKLGCCLFGLVLTVGVIQVARTNANQLFEQLPMTNAERSLVRQLKREHEWKERLIVSDVNSMRMLTYYIDTPSVVLLDTKRKGYAGVDVAQLMTFFNTSALSAAEADFLDGLGEQTGAAEIYVLISHRTRVALDSFLATRSLGGSGVPKNFTDYPPVPARRKLLSGPFRPVFGKMDPDDSSVVMLFKYESRAR